MKGHLAAEVFTELLTGSRNRDAEEHLSECEACRLELLSLEATLEEFGTAVRHWGDTEYRNSHSYRVRTYDYRQLRFGLPRWVSPAASAVALVLLGLLIGERLRQDLPAPPVLQQASISDAALWSEIDEQTSRTVSPAMDPLLGRISHDGSAAGARGIIR